MGNADIVRLNKAVGMALLLKRFMGMDGSDLDQYLPDCPAGDAHLEAQAKVIRAEAK